MMKKGIICWVVSAILILAGGARTASALDIRNHLSPRNRERPRRSHSYYIILHTTEAPEKSSLNKLTENGEAHYLVGRNGVVYRVVEKSRVAYHAGTSMWNGHENIDDYALGIEVVGYHDRDITAAQYVAVRELLEQLQRIYRIPDENVLTHSMVAYGNPNKWHKRPHRGRKRCGMLFAQIPVRRRLGLTRKAAYDPDVKAGRLAVADQELANVLYGRSRASLRLAGVNGVFDESGGVVGKGCTPWDIAGSAYKSEGVIYIYPDGRRVRGSEVKNWKTIPLGTRVVFQAASDATLAAESPADVQMDQSGVGVLVVGEHGENAASIAGAAQRSGSTIYLFPDGRVRCGNELTEQEVARVPKQTAMLVGYVYGGHITEKKTAYDICAERWDDSDTYYRLTDGRLVAGHTLAEGRIPRNSLVFFRH